MEWARINTENLLDLQTLPGILMLGVIMFLLSGLLSFLLTRIILRSQKVARRFGRQADETILRYAIRLKTLLIFITAFLVFVSLVPGLEPLLGTLVAGAGVSALVLGFAAQSTLANLVSGIGLAVYRPFRIGDKVTIDGEYGTIEDMTFRHTIVCTWENKRLVIPNKNIDNMTLMNHSLIDLKIMCRIDFGVSYDTDLDLAMRLIREEASRCPHRMTGSEDPRTRVFSHGDFSIGIRAYVWAPDMDGALELKWWMMEQVKKRFDAEGIEIPFPYRTVVYKNDLPEPRQGDGERA
ncbi:mechanosensitive ion channel family protein [Candidatus Zixiibacteriota bacterium]